jgi:hypothetical protein
MPRPLARIGSLAALGSALALPAVAAAFQSGDLYLLSRGLPVIGEGILRIDPATGATSVLVDAPTSLRPSFSYDAWRDRLLFVEMVGTGVRTADDAGGLATLPTGLAAPMQIAARGDGKVYLWFGPGTAPPAPAAGFGYLDASNALHDLLNAGGTARQTFPSSFQDMLYDPGTNSLLCFSGVPFGPCPAANQTCAVRIPLTADGTQVAGALQFVQVDISTSLESVDGSSRMPGGDVMVIVDTNSNDREPRMQRLDPATMTFSPFASNGPYTGAAATDSGGWHAGLGRALILDTFANTLRSFASGEVGGGTAFATGVSTTGSGEDARLLQIPSGPAVPGLPGWAIVALACGLAAACARPRA